MILIEETFKKYKYIPVSLRPYSGKYIVVCCDYCNIIFDIKKSVNTRNSLVINKDCCKNKECKSKKYKECCNKRYGVSNYFATPEAKIKLKEYYINKYGVDNPAKVKEIKAKIEKTCLEKYGSKAYLGSKEGQAKMKDHCLKTYGTTNYFSSEEGKINLKNILKEKYGVEYVGQIPGMSARRAKTNLAKYGAVSVLTLPENRAKRDKALVKYGKREKELKTWLNSLGCNFVKDFKLVAPFEIDMYDSNIKLAIEYCGLYWHSEDSLEPRDRYYHLYKNEMCNKQGVQLITIFEDEWKRRQEQIKSYLRSKLNIITNKIFVRDCNINSIDPKICKEFISKYHIQSKKKLSLYSYGIFLNEELLGVMSFNIHHRNNKDINLIVLDRLCFKDGVNIVGGSFRLFKYAIKELKEKGYTKIISWSDNRWSQGKVYEKMGFININNSKPDYTYIYLKNPLIRISKQSMKKYIVNCPEGKTELQYNRERGYSRVWDCGKIRWEYTIN